MAKATRFGKGSSGSMKHTETYGTGRQLQDGAGRTANGPAIGPGVFSNRVRPEMGRESAQKRPAIGKMPTYSEE